MKTPFGFISHKTVLWILGLFPSILLIALCNSRAMGKQTENSDIDLFIIAKSGQLWTARFLTTMISSLLGVRRGNTHGLIKGSPEYIRKTKDKFCLSFFITEDAMNLDTIRIENDIYLDKWIQTLVPLVNKNKTLERFWEVNTSKLSLQKNNTKGVFEGLVQTIWLPRTLKTYERLGKPWGVIISDTMLKFHDNDQRKIYRDNHIG